MNARKELHKELRNEREANAALANHELRIITLPPGFMKLVPVRVPQKCGIISTFIKFLGR